MKKILLGLFLLISFAAQGQNLCLATQCTATKAHVGDTVMIGAILTANAGVSNISFTFQSGPNTPIISPVNNSFLSGVADTGRVSVMGLIAGTYLIKVVGADKSGGITAPQYDSIVVSPAVTCPPIPAPPTFTKISVTIFGVPIVVPPGQTTITFMYNGVLQTITF